jgi:hypothetical protein
MALALAGFAVGDVVLLLGALDGQSGEFLVAPETLLWVALIGTLTASWAIFVVPLSTTMTNLLALLRSKRTELVRDKTDLLREQRNLLRKKTIATWLSLTAMILLFAILSSRLSDGLGLE